MKNQAIIIDGIFHYHQECVCGNVMECKLAEEDVKSGWAFTCRECGRWYAHEWTDPVREHKVHPEDALQLDKQTLIRKERHARR